MLSSGYDDYAAAVTSTAAELHRAGIGHLLGFETEVPHPFGSRYVQRADLVMRAPASGVPVLSLEIDLRTEDAHELVHKLRRYWKWGVCWRRTSTSTPWIWSVPGRTRSRTSATRSGCGGGSTRRPAEEQTRMRLHGV
ncbi:hypothetical protein [Streptomyces mutabilis]|uniref:hypothetical protein n=1 Tax=Streptomyces mutabilis TaxID=67332 RepID=UPI00211C534E|nr:hypothetical protein [Streptomyces sp. alain-838]